jgi:hypothetical protein
VPASTPMAAEHQMVAEVFMPQTLTPSRRMTTLVRIW